MFTLVFIYVDSWSITETSRDLGFLTTSYVLNNRIKSDTLNSETGWER